MNTKIVTQTQSSPRGFTLVELLIVVIIIAVLTAIGFPLASKVRASANRTQCLDRLHSWAIAFGAYAADHDGKVAWKNWAPIGWSVDSASPYLSYWTSETVNLPGNDDAGSHAIQLQMRHCPAMPSPKNGGNPSVDYAMIRPSPAVANASDYSLASIKNPARFLMMIETISHSGTPIAASSELNTRVKPLTVTGPNLRHNHSVNAVLGDFSVKSMSWKDLEPGITNDYWTKL